MSAGAEFQKLLIDTLTADSAVAAIVGADVYDEPPTDRPRTFISIGASDFRPEKFDCVVSREHTVQVDVFNREGLKRVNTRRLVDGIVAALDDVDLSLPDPYALTRVFVELATVFDEPDGLSTRGVVQVTAIIETVAE